MFDIDGCLTLPQQDTSQLDIPLMTKIAGFNTPVALVTGRSDGWLRKQYDQHNRNDLLNIPTYIEFGLAMIDNGNVKIMQQATDFLSLREEMIDKLAEAARNRNLYFEPDTWYDDYPDHGSLWVEDKHIQLSIAANSSITPSEVHNLVSEAWRSYGDQARILYHHLGVDVIPREWSKAEATSDIISDLQEDDYHWYVFGDNESDREMLQGLTHATFISTLEQASLQVRTVLNSLGLL